MAANGPPTLSPKPSFRSRIGTVLRRSSTGFGLGAPTSNDSESTTSLPGSSEEGTGLGVDTALQSQIVPRTVISPVAESPAREAEASLSSPVFALPGVIQTSSSQETSRQNLIDSPKSQKSSLPDEGQASENGSDAQPALAKTLGMTPQLVQEEEPIPAVTQVPGEQATITGDHVGGPPLGTKQAPCSECTDVPSEQAEEGPSMSHGKTISMLLPAVYEVIGSGGGESGSANLGIGETTPLLPTPTNNRDPRNCQTALSYTHSPGEATRTHLRPAGPRKITLPDSSVYFHDPTQRITTDVHFEVIPSHLMDSPPEGWELWVANFGRKADPRPISGWINHAEKILTFEHPPLPQFWEFSDSERLGDDRLDLEYRYWAFMESHPAHASLPPNARSDALDALSWSYTDCLLPSVRPVPPPFSQDECQELTKLLETLGHSTLSESQDMVHTRIVSRILMRQVQWRQHWFRPDRPLPRGASDCGPRRAGGTSPSRFGNLLVSTVCLGLPYLFIRRANPLRITDEESVTRSVGPMLAIGACSCLAAAVILSASVTLVSLPGLDNSGRIAGSVAVLCSAASMILTVIAIFHYKIDVEQPVVYMDGEGLGTLSGRSIVMSLPLVSLSWGIIAFVTAIMLYSF